MVCTGSISPDDRVGQRSAVLFDQRDDGLFALSRTMAAIDQHAAAQPNGQHEHDDQRDPV
jgi:hypothetical protein